MANALFRHSKNRGAPTYALFSCPAFHSKKLLPTRKIGRKYRMWHGSCFIHFLAQPIDVSHIEKSKSRKHHSMSNTYNVSKQGGREWMTYRLLLSEKMTKLNRDFCSSSTCWDSERRKLSASEKMSALLFISEKQDFTLGICQCLYHGLAFL